MKRSLKELILGVPQTDTQVHSHAKSTQAWLPIADVQDGIVITKDSRYIKILEIIPINFHLMSDLEQASIISYFAAYLKVAPRNMEIRVTTEKADMGQYIRHMRECWETEENERCRMTIENNIAFVTDISHRVAVTHRFLLVFQYEPRFQNGRTDFPEICRSLNEEEAKARKYLDICGLEVVTPDETAPYIIDLLHAIINKRSSQAERHVGKAACNAAGEVQGLEALRHD